MHSFTVNVQLVPDATGELNTLRIVYEAGSELASHEAKAPTTKRRGSVMVPPSNSKEAAEPKQRRQSVMFPSNFSSLSQVGILILNVNRKGALLNFVRARVFVC